MNRRYSERVSRKLHIAISRGDIKTVISMMDAGYYLEEEGYLGFTPLSAACQAAMTKIISYLIDIGANLEGGMAVVPLEKAIEYNRFDVVKLLVEKGVNVNHITAPRNTALSLAITKGSLKIATYLIENGANVNQPCGQSTPLRRAIGVKNYAMMKLLLENKAKVNAISDTGTTPLYIAALSGDLVAVKMLLSYGATLNEDLVNRSNIKLKRRVIMNDLSNSFELCEEYDNEVGFRIFRIWGAAIRKEMIEITQKKRLKVAKYLIRRGINVNSVNEDNVTPLYESLENNNAEMAMFLIENGADTNIANVFGSLPIHVSIKGCHDEITRILIETVDVNTESSGSSLLTWAVMANNITSVKMLLRKGANVNAVNYLNRTTLDTLFIHGNVCLHPKGSLENEIRERVCIGGIIRLLIENGATVINDEAPYPRSMIDKMYFSVIRIMDAIDLSWSITTHHKFGDKTKERIKTVMKIWKRKTPASVLIKDVLFQIFFQLCKYENC